MFVEILEIEACVASVSTILWNTEFLIFVINHFLKTCMPF